MKKATRLFITGSLQSLFFRQFVKEHADSYNIKGFLRKLEDGRIEIFMEGQAVDVDAMVKICSRGPKYAQIRNVEQKEEKLQDFTEFRILSI